jgi:hypothetical protein
MIRRCRLSNKKNGGITLKVTVTGASVSKMVIECSDATSMTSDTKERNNCFAPTTRTATDLLPHCHKSSRSNQNRAFSDVLFVHLSIFRTADQLRLANDIRQWKGHLTWILSINKTKRNGYKKNSTTIKQTTVWLSFVLSFVEKQSRHTMLSKGQWENHRLNRTDQADFPAKYRMVISRRQQRREWLAACEVGRPMPDFPRWRFAEWHEGPKREYRGNIRATKEQRVCMRVCVKRRVQWRSLTVRGAPENRRLKSFTPLITICLSSLFLDDCSSAVKHCRSTVT